MVSGKQEDMCSLNKIALISGKSKHKLPTNRRPRNTSKENTHTTCEYYKNWAAEHTYLWALTPNITEIQVEAKTRENKSPRTRPTAKGITL